MKRDQGSVVPRYKNWNSRDSVFLLARETRREEEEERTRKSDTSVVRRSLPSRDSIETTGIGNEVLKPDE